MERKPLRVTDKARRFRCPPGSDWTDPESRLSFRVIKKIAKTIYSSSRTAPANKPSCFSVSRLLCGEIASRCGSFGEYKMKVKRLIWEIGERKEEVSASLGQEEETKGEGLIALLNFSL